jgi:hypothetical protein
MLASSALVLVLSWTVSSFCFSSSSRWCSTANWPGHLRAGVVSWSSTTSLEFSSPSDIRLRRSLRTSSRSSAISSSRLHWPRGLRVWKDRSLLEIPDFIEQTGMVSFPACSVGRRTSSDLALSCDASASYAPLSCSCSDGLRLPLCWRFTWRTPPHRVYHSSSCIGRVYRDFFLEYTTRLRRTSPDPGSSHLVRNLHALRLLLVFDYYWSSPSWWPRRRERRLGRTGVTRTACVIVPLIMIFWTRQCGPPCSASRSVVCPVLTEELSIRNFV